MKLFNKKLNKLDSFVVGLVVFSIILFIFALIKVNTVKADSPDVSYLESITLGWTNNYTTTDIYPAVDIDSDADDFFLIKLSGSSTNIGRITSFTYGTAGDRSELVSITGVVSTLDNSKFYKLVSPISDGYFAITFSSKYVGVVMELIGFTKDLIDLENVFLSGDTDVLDSWELTKNAYFTPIDDNSLLLYFITDADRSQTVATISNDKNDSAITNYFEDSVGTRWGSYFYQYNDNTDLNNLEFTFSTAYPAYVYTLELGVVGSENNDYTMYYSENPKYIPINTSGSLQFVYNLCDYYATDESADFTAHLVNSETDVDIGGSLYLGEGCSGTASFSYTPISDEVFTAYIQIEEFDGSMTPIFTNDFFVAGYSTIVGGINETFIKPSFNPFFSFDIQESVSTTTLPFAYNFCENSYFDDLVEPVICVENRDGANNSTGYCSDVLDSCGGLVAVDDFPVSTSTPMTIVFSTGLYDDDDDSRLYSSDYNFQLITYDSGSTPVVYTDENIAFVTLWGSPHDLACDATAWASSDWWDELRCGFTESFLTTIFKVLDTFMSFLKTLYSGFVNFLKMVFPFNLVYELRTQWVWSSTGVFPSDLNTFNTMTSSTTLSMVVPASMVGSSSDIVLPVWGDDVFNDNEAVSDLFSLFRVLSKYLMYALFLFYVFRVGQDVYDSISPEGQTPNNKDI